MTNERLFYKILAIFAIFICVCARPLQDGQTFIKPTKTAQKNYAVLLLFLQIRGIIILYEKNAEKNHAFIR